MAFTPTRLTMADAEAVVRDGQQAIASGISEINFGRLEHFDSSAIATVLAWRRAAVERGVSLRIGGVPEGLLSLARVYGVAPLLGGQH